MVEHAEPPRGQKRSANSLFSDLPRPIEDPSLDLDSPDTPSTELSGDTADLGDQLPKFVDLFAQQMFGEGMMNLHMSGSSGDLQN